MARQGKPAPRSGAAADIIWGVLGPLAAAALATALYLWAPIERGLAVPVGADTPAHLWRARLVAAQGLHALFTSAPYNFQVNPDRLGLPVLASLLTGAGVSPWLLAFIVPALAAAILAPAAWALAGTVSEPRWAGAIYAGAVVTSIPFALTTRTNLDNALADGLIVAAAAASLLAASEPAGRCAGALLLAGSLLMHWPTGSVFAVVLALLALFLLPEAVAGMRRGQTLLGSGAARVTTIVAGGLAVGGLPLLATPGANLPDQGTGRFFRGNVQRLLPLYRLPVVLPVAAAGAVALTVSEPRPPKRRALLLAVAWSIPVVLAAVAYARGALIPLMRFLQVAFPIPLLGAAAVVGVIRLAARTGRVRVPVVAIASVLAAAAVGLAAVLAHDAVAAARPSVTDTQLGPINAVAAFLEQDHPSSVTIVTDGDAGLPFRRVRMLAPAGMIQRIGVFHGSVGDLFEAAAGPPAPLDPDLQGTNEKRAQINADAVRRMRLPGAAALALRPFIHTYDRLAQDPRNVEIADGVLVLRPGTPPPAVTQPAPLAPPTGRALIAASLASLLVLAAAGSGWSVLLLPRPWTLRAGLTPAIGLATLLVVGTLAGLGGLRTDHWRGLALATGTAVAGWAAVLLVRRDHARPRSRAGEPARTRPEA